LPARGTASPNGLAVFLERAVREALLVAQLHAAQVEHAVLHGASHALPLAAVRAVIERGDDAEREVQARPRVADLRACHERKAVAEPGGRGGAAGTLRDVLVHLAVLVRPRPEALDRGVDHARVELVDALPGEAHAVERARREVLDQHVAALHQPLEDVHALLVLAVDGDRPLVVVQHREVEAVGIGDVTQLLARDVARAGALHLDDVRAEPRKQLRARRSRLNMREIQDAHAVECLA
jgi:hypothetical protein